MPQELLEQAVNDKQYAGGLNEVVIEQDEDGNDT
jgi:hypothetical protein